MRDSSAPAPVFLLTDFGTQDPYVGLMKAVLVREPPRPDVIDLTHEVPPQDEVAASFLLEYVLPDLPSGAVLLLVVDPGVGTERGILAVALDRGRRVLAPDTGMLEGLSWERAVRFENREWMRDTGVSTFHGRDRFAPAGRHLSLGGELSDLGPELDRAPRGSPVPEPVSEGDRLVGRVVYADRFGNLITNITPDHLPHPDVPHAEANRSVVLTVDGHTVRGIRKTYGDHEGPIGLVGSFERVEIAVPGGSARRRLAVEPGDPVEMHTE